MIYNWYIEIRRAMQELYEYKFNLLFANIGLIFLFTGLLQFVSSDDKEVTLLLMMAWYSGTHGFSNIAYILEDEIIDGTIVNILQSKISLYYVVWMRAGIQLLADFIKSIGVFIIIILLEDIVYQCSFHIMFDMFIGVTIAILVTYGIGFCIGSLAIRYRKIIAVAELFYYFVLFFSGVIYNVQNLYVLNGLNMLLPFGSLRNLLTNLYYYERLDTPSLFHLFLLLFVWICVGSILFHAAVKRGLDLGSIYEE